MYIYIYIMYIYIYILDVRPGGYKPTYDWGSPCNNLSLQLFEVLRNLSTQLLNRLILQVSKGMLSDPLCINQQECFGCSSHNYGITIAAILSAHQLGRHRSAGQKAAHFKGLPAL